MATKEAVIQRYTFDADPTLLAYSEEEDNGHALAGQDIAVMVNSSGLVVPATTQRAIVGRLDVVMRSQKCTVTTFGQDVAFKQGAVGGCDVGDGIVGASGPSIGGQTNGYVTRAPNDDQTSAIVTSRKSRGYVIKVVSNTAGGEVRVIFP